MLVATSISEGGKYYAKLVRNQDTQELKKVTLRSYTSTGTGDAKHLTEEPHHEKTQ